MKYLRHINEGNKVNDVEDFIKDHLAYLFDDQTFDVKVEVLPGDPKKYRIMIYKPGTETTLKYITDGVKRVNADRFTWTEVKEYCLPFIHFLKKEYSVISFSFFDKESHYIDQKINTINNNFTYNKPIYSLNIEIFGETIYEYLANMKDVGDQLLKIESNDNYSVWVKRTIVTRWRVYYIFFKNVIATKDNPCKALKLNYDTQSSAHYNFHIQYDNFKRCEFNSLDTILNRNNIDFGDFNRAWYHVEENYNNR